jgi:hypothetical protein
MAKFDKSLADTRAVRDEIAHDLRPLFDHLINLALNSHERGYAKRAGRELLQARRLARHGKTASLRRARSRRHKSKRSRAMRLRSRRARSRLHRRISRRRGSSSLMRLQPWQGPTKKHNYWEWTIHSSDRDAGDDYYKGVVFADSADEQGDQNVNWEVVYGENASFKRGHTRTVRSAMRAVEQFLASK